MTKREVLHKIIDRICDIEAGSNKVAFVFYTGGQFESLSFHFAPNYKNIHKRIFQSKSIYLNTRTNLVTTAEELEQLFTDLDALEKLPDGPVEEVLKFELTESKARELGLIEKAI
jgi:hypothetical protein